MGYVPGWHQKHSNPRFSDRARAGEESGPRNVIRVYSSHTQGHGGRGLACITHWRNWRASPGAGVSTLVPKLGVVNFPDKASELFTDLEGLAASCLRYQKFCITLPSTTYNFTVTQRHSYCSLERLMIKTPLTLAIAFTPACIGGTH